MSSRTFAALGAPFQLFEAPVDACSGYESEQTCSFCRQMCAVCFRLGIGDDMILPCGSCETELPLSVTDREPAICNCGQVTSFPENAPQEFLVCYHCLRAGRCALTKDTELGMITFQHAMAGQTHGRPGLSKAGYDLVPVEDEWVAARLPKEMMLELLRTPGYITWQGESWLFCCGGPMTYVGEVKPSDLRAQRGNGLDLLEQAFGTKDLDISRLTKDIETESLVVYEFRCLTCGRHSANCDFD
jgi:uncharacterized protein CbrC (UPF0167 family)